MVLFEWKYAVKDRQIRNMVIGRYSDVNIMSRQVGRLTVCDSMRHVWNKILTMGYPKLGCTKLDYVRILVLG